MSAAATTVPGADRTAGPTASRGQSTPLRPEIQALRALAVLAVLVYHLVPARFPGGYVGVDIFFVISGFLITGHLLRELERHDRIAVAAFWARRAKRLLPAALLVLAVVTAGVVALVPRVLWNQYLGETLAATLYVENWRLAADAVDYLAAGNHPSPVQHFWSLSVEEQFYFVLPLLIMLGAFAARRFGLPRRKVLFALLAVIALVSLVVSVRLTATNPGVAYFSTATRGWEFAAGGLLAFAPAKGPLAVRAAAAGLGTAAIALTLVLFSGRTPFPGSAALLPVLGTAAVIWAGTLPWRMTPSGAGTWAPVATLGRVSYSVYLWHWPLIVLLPMATGVKLRLVDMAAVVIASLLLALATTMWVEDPVRFSPRLLGSGRRPRTVALWSLAGMAVIAAVTSGALLISRAALAEARLELAQVRSAPVTCFGAATLGAVASDCADVPVPDHLVPHPVLAPEDGAGPGGCWAGNDERELQMCTLGPTEGYTKRVLALGDSHSNMLVPAHQYAAEELGWRIDVAGHANCYWTRATTHNAVRAFEEACADWRAAVEAHLDASEPYDAIVVIATRTAELVDTPGDVAADEAATIQGLHDAWVDQLARGSAVVVVSDVPQPRRDVVECVVRFEATATDRCTTPRSAALELPDILVRAAAADGLDVVDMTDLFCDEQRCHAVVGHVVVWRDRGHVTGTFARTLGPALAERLAAVLDPS